jgi:hypothetical protein
MEVVPLDLSFPFSSLCLNHEAQILNRSIERYAEQAMCSESRKQRRNLKLRKTTSHQFLISWYCHRCCPLAACRPPPVSSVSLMPDPLVSASGSESNVPCVTVCKCECPSRNGCCRPPLRRVCDRERRAAVHSLHFYRY